MRIIRYLIAILAFAGAATAAANAATVTIDFNGHVNDDFDPDETYSEDGYTFRVLSGSEFAIDSASDTNDILEIGDNARPEIGDTISITADNGGLFSFDSVDYAKAGLLGSYRVNLVGLVNGVIVDAYQDLMAASRTFNTLDPLFSNMIDELQIIVASDGGYNELLLDDFVFTSGSEVPLPAAVWMFLAGLGGLGFARQQSNRN